VYIEAVTPVGLSELSPEEDEMLSGVAAERKENSRLSCQITLTEQLTEIVARLPERQL
jgi:2Fe-2S ferredoxin